MRKLAQIETAIHKEENLAEVLHAVRRYARGAGVIRQGYIFIPLFAEPSSLKRAMYTVGFPGGWLADYANKGFRSIDPIPLYTMKKGTMAYWAEAIASCIDKPGVKMFADAMDHYGLRHGFGVPLYGPNNCNAFCFFDFDIPQEEQNFEIILQLRLLSQVAHQRICHLLEKKREIPTLSERENQVLRWIASGKSNLDIATILGISTETVRTYTQRIYSKLNATDRTSAAVKGLKLGILGDSDF